MSAETASDRQKEGPSAFPTARLTPACQPIARFPHHPVTPLLYGKTSRIIGKTPPKPHFSRLCREIFPALRQETNFFQHKNSGQSAKELTFRRFLRLGNAPYEHFSPRRASRMRRSPVFCVRGNDRFLPFWQVCFPKNIPKRRVHANGGNCLKDFMERKCVH